MAELAKRLLSLVIYLAFMLAAMFWPAGTWDWPHGWRFIALYWIVMAIACVWLCRVRAARKAALDTERLVDGIGGA